MVTYRNLILQNVAFSNAEKIVVYSGESKIGTIGLHCLAMPQLGEKLYSFGAISDIHLQYQTAQTDFQTALTYLNDEEDVEFTCICGDLTSAGGTAQLAQYQTTVQTYSPNTPVYAIFGNHDTRDASWAQQSESVVMQNALTYTGHPLYYTFTRGNDVFIMLGLASDTVGDLFADGELEWLQETLEANQDKRCFVFEHVRPQDGCGNAYGIYNYDIWGGEEATAFENLMCAHHNVILFHGHSHLKFDLQTKNNLANYDNLFGCHSVHIPSLAVPRSGDATGANSMTMLYSESEGYVVDVYRNHIVLRGRNFVTGEFIPLATYCLAST